MDDQLHHLTISSTIELPSPLLQLLCNPLILYHIVPYLPITSLLRLGTVSKDFKTLIYETPNVFRYLKLSETKSAQSEIGSIDNGGEIWRNVQLDESVTEYELVIFLSCQRSLFDTSPIAFTVGP